MTLVVDEVTGGRKKKFGGMVGGGIITTTITTSNSSSNSYYIINTIIWPAFPRPQRAAGLGEHEIGRDTAGMREASQLASLGSDRVPRVGRRGQQHDRSWVARG